MASRREIREAAVQFLYCADMEDTPEKEVLYKTFWSIVLESDEKQLLKAKSKALIHLNQARSSRYSKLVEKVQETQAIIKTFSEALSLSDTFHQILDKENAWQVLIDRTTRYLKAESSSALEELEITLDEIFTTNHVLISLRKTFLQKIKDHPELSKKIEGTTAQITALQRVGERLLRIEEPELFPEQTDISHLRNSAEKMKQYREAVDLYVTGVLKKKEIIDKHIAEVVENFSPERIDPVDRSVLRLATYEILFEKDIPAAVSINEGIEIVKRFGSNESARFTNGILDKIAKNIEKN